MEITNNANRLFLKIIAYFSEVESQQIPHTLNVAYFTRIIARNENESEHRIILLETAAMLHDIGCPISKKKYGNSLPVNQEKEGRIIATEMLATETWLSIEEKEWIAEVVGTHHRRKFADELNYGAVFDADIIVNTLEGYYPAAKADTYYKMLFTDTGRIIFSETFLQ